MSGQGIGANLEQSSTRGTVNDLLHFISFTDNIPDTMQRTVAWLNAPSARRSQSCSALLGKELRLWPCRRLGVLAGEDCVLIEAGSVSPLLNMFTCARRVSVTVLQQNDGLSNREVYVLV